MFKDLKIETLRIIRQRLESELKDPELPLGRKREVEGFIYNINECIRFKTEHKN